MRQPSRRLGQLGHRGALAADMDKTRKVVRPAADGSNASAYEEALAGSICVA